MLVTNLVERKYMADEITESTQEEVQQNPIEAPTHTETMLEQIKEGIEKEVEQVTQSALKSHFSGDEYKAFVDMIEPPKSKIVTLSEPPQDQS